MKVIIVLPVYNEEKALGPLFERVEKSRAEAGVPDEVVVVDDGSRDASLAVAGSFARRFPLAIVRHEKNEGLGRAIRDGLVFALRRCSDEDVVVTMDADNSQPPELIPQMLKPTATGSDCVIASRYAPGSRIVHGPLYRRLISWVGNKAYAVRLRATGVRDYTCGFRAYRVSILKEGFRLYGDRFIASRGFECMGEILLKLSGLGARVSEVPFTLDYGAKPGLSKMRLLRTLLGNLRVLATPRYPGSA
jgi:dolichol-phosphate mannosyltransferase